MRTSKNWKLVPRDTHSKTGEKGISSHPKVLLLPRGDDDLSLWVPLLLILNLSWTKVYCWGVLRWGSLQPCKSFTHSHRLRRSRGPFIGPDCRVGRVSRVSYKRLAPVKTPLLCPFVVHRGYTPFFRATWVRSFRTDVSHWGRCSLLSEHTCSRREWILESSGPKTRVGFRMFSFSSF